jgi:carbonic anhydrase
MIATLMKHRATLQRELSASIVVFLVSLPLSMGIALASGAPLLSGLIAAAAGGIVAGCLGGAPLLVSGPAAGLAVVVVDIGSSFGFAAVSLITLFAGLLQLVLGSLKVARYATAIAPAVLHGMLAGIGLLIAVAQLHVILGSASSPSIVTNLLHLPQALAHANVAGAAIGLLTVAILVAWPRLPLYRLRVPPALAAVGLSTLVATLLNLQIPHVSLPTTFVWAPPQMGDLPWLPILASTLAMALIASAESLLSAVAVDKLHSGPRAQLDRELLGQGAANLVSGFLGGLPVTGVIVRSTANIEAGAKTRWSTVLHGVWVVLAVSFLGSVLSAVPLTALAGLLVVVGCRLVSFKHIRDLHRHGESLVYAVTVVGVVGINLLAGIAMGFVAALLRLLWQLTRARLEVQEQADKSMRIDMSGAITFLLVPKMTEAFAQVPPGKHVEVTIRTLLMDHAAREALNDWQENYQAQAGGGRVTLNVQSMSGERRTSVQVTG